MASAMVLFEQNLHIIFLFIGLVIVYFIIREIRLMYTRTKQAQLDLEKEKISLMKADMEKKESPFFRVPPDKMEEIKILDEDNILLETDIFARQSAIEKRIQRLENRVKLTKLDRMVEKIKKEEDRLG